MIFLRYRNVIKHPSFASAWVIWNLSNFVYVTVMGAGTGVLFIGTQGPKMGLETHRSALWKGDLKY